MARQGQTDRMHRQHDPERRPARLLLVEDEPQLAELTAELLGDDYEVDVAEDGERGIELALRRHYDAIVVDRRLPGIDGLGVVAAIRRARIRTPVLMLTALGTVDDRVSGLDGGANDYLVKPYDADELLARLRALRRGFAAETERVEIGDWTFVPGDGAVYGPTGARVVLTDTEAALLAVLAGSPDRVFSREELLDAAFAAGETTNVVDTYVHYLRRKTHHGLIETIRARGYRLGGAA